ncbi:MAG: hypothetical protein H7289_07190, partial [Mucilaginibacter sp.]|nr:hypothetical protein [Mucilaginibacter sp.]
LKHILTQNSFQEKITFDNEQRKEAELILSQEYLIALEPYPEYQLWCLELLVLLWYFEPDIYNNIRYIKILINQYRSKNSEEYNVKYGILPSIVIFPKYGEISANLIMSSLHKYFYKSNSLTWKCSTPSYFVGTNNNLICSK